jgi:hypothetical protein
MLPAILMLTPKLSVVQLTQQALVILVGSMKIKMQGSRGVK